MSITVYSPASMGNISVGFDLLGAALAPIDGTLLGDTVSIKEADTFILKVEGSWAHKLDADYKKNIVYMCCEYFFENNPGLDNKIEITLSKNLPVGSGLGSSACSVVASFYALNEFYKHPYTQQKLLRLMGEFEGKISGSIHYDNVAPSYLGGMQLMLESGDAISQAIPSFDNWYWVVAYPGISLSTAMMRALLPAQYERADLISFGRNLAGFIHASYKSDAKLALELLNDVVAEPYRAASIPGFVDANKHLTSLGLKVGISGSGPTLFAIATNLELAQTAKEWLDKNYLQETGFSHICKLDKHGTRVV